MSNLEKGWSPMEWDEYLRARAFYQDKGRRALTQQDEQEADYSAGVVRGLDLAMNAKLERIEQPFEPVCGDCLYPLSKCQHDKTGE